MHIGWLFVLPFGLCNLAYWARRDITGTDEDPKWWAGGDGAVAIRVFALLQTLFYTVGFLTVFVHLVALQCFRAVESAAGERAYEACAVLPGWLDFVAGWSATARAAAFSTGAIVVILLIYVIGLRARGMFNPQRSFDDDAKPRAARKRGAAPTGEADPPRPALLESTGFWHRSRVAQTSERAHLAAAIALTVSLLAVDAVLDAGTNVSAGSEAVPLGIAVVGGVLLVGAFATTAAAGLSGKIWSTRNKRGWSTVLLVVSIIVYVAWLVWALLVARDDVAGDGGFAGDDTLRGLIVAPTVIAALCALIAVASLAWGYRSRRVAMWILLPLALVSAFVSGADGLAGEAGWMRPAFAIAAVGFVVLAVVVAYWPHRDPEVATARLHSGWHGNGATVVLLLALFASLMITSLLVLGTHAWLTTDGDKPVVRGSWRLVDPPASEAIAPPTFHERFGGMLVLILLVFILFALAAVVASLRRFPAFSLPGPEFAADLGGVGRLVGADEQPGASAGTADRTIPRAVSAREYPPNEANPSGRLRAVADARRIAGLTQRGEPVLRVLAVLTAFALVPLALPYFGELLERVAPGVWGTLTAISGWALGFLALAAVGWVVMNAVTSTERPLGIVWDIICFFPRAGHPFTPPCYGERSVPEVSKRIKRWVAETTEAGDDPHVILSAHSMGATIAVGVILSLYGDRDLDTLERVSLLTHGVQLRPYFSRFFPEVFGPRVLGIAGTRGPGLLSADPWRRQVLDDSWPPVAPEHGDDDPPSVVEILGGDLRDPERVVVPRWRSLWRRTDFLGFPVAGYWSNPAGVGGPNPIDRGATERSPRSYLWTIARHNDYLSTPQYRAARSELIDMILARKTVP